MTDEEIRIIWQELTSSLRELAWVIFFDLCDSIEKLKKEASELNLELE